MNWKVKLLVIGLLFGGLAGLMLADLVRDEFWGSLGIMLFGACVFLICIIPDPLEMIAKMLAKETARGSSEVHRKVNRVMRSDFIRAAKENTTTISFFLSEVNLRQSDVMAAWIAAVCQGSNEAVFELGKYQPDLFNLACFDGGETAGHVMVRMKAWAALARAVKDHALDLYRANAAGKKVWDMIPSEIKKGLFEAFKQTMESGGVTTKSDEYCVNPT